MKRSKAVARGMLTIGALWLGAGCSDAYLEDRIDTLGEDDAGFEETALHRPGQPCLWCHSEYEGAQPILSIGGTLFTEPTDAATAPFPVPGYIIRILDSEGTFRELPTNACGNFFISRDDFDPAYPLRAELFGPTVGSTSITQIRVMSTRIGRDGSCGTCHMHPASPFSPGVVFVPQAQINAVLPADGACPPARFAPQL